MTRGVVYVHSSPLAVCPHVEWAIARVLSAPVRLELRPSPITCTATEEPDWSFRWKSWPICTTRTACWRSMVSPTSPARRSSATRSNTPVPSSLAISCREAALRSWSMLRFEVTEEPSPGIDGERFMHVPGRGVFRSATSANGDLVLSEDRLRAMVASARGYEALAHALDKALGAAWDAELEPYRHAGEGHPVTLLTRVG